MRVPHCRRTPPGCTPEAPAPIAVRSKTATRAPRACSSRAIASPTTPAPTTATSRAHSPLRRSASVAALKRISENVAVQPSPSGDWATKPNLDRARRPSARSGARAARAFRRSRSERRTARPIRAIRSQTALPSTTVELQSSDAARVTTETTIGSRSGEYSKQSFAQVCSSRHSASTPASNVERELDLDPRAEQEVARASLRRGPVRRASPGRGPGRRTSRCAGRPRSSGSRRRSTKRGVCPGCVARTEGVMVPPCRRLSRLGVMLAS